jgi:MmyB-like transcription regulator ligand binding domain
MPSGGREGWGEVRGQGSQFLDSGVDGGESPVGPPQLGAGTRADRRDPHPGGHDLVGELSTQSAEFRTRWAAHNVRFHDTGTKDLHHPVVGDLTLTYNRMEVRPTPAWHS